MIVGTGFIGLEMAESLYKLGIKITLVEALPQVTPGFDSDMAVYLEKYIRSQGIELGIKGAIKVNPKMVTSISDIYACGDCTENFSPTAIKG